MLTDISPERLLRWYLEAGADECIGEVPVDRYARPAHGAPRPSHRAEPPQPGPVPPQPATAPPPLSPQAGPSAAHLAAACATLADLRAAVEAFEGHPLKAGATVFGDGNPEARLMVIGDTPGDEACARLLARMLASIGLGRDGAYVTTVLPWRIAPSRKLSPQDAEIMLPFLERHIELVDPDVLLLMGRSAIATLLATGDGISQLRGRWLSFSSSGLSRPLPAAVTFPLAYLLNTPEAKALAWRDLLMVRQRLQAPL